MVCSRNQKSILQESKIKVNLLVKILALYIFNEYKTKVKVVSQKSCHLKAIGTRFLASETLERSASDVTIVVPDI